MEGDDDKLVMTRAELRRWIKERTKQRGKELSASSSALRGSRLQSLLDKTGRRRREYEAVRKTVEECEAFVKDLYKTLDLEYRDTDSEDEASRSDTEDGAAAETLGDEDGAEDRSGMPHLTPYDVVPSGSPDGSDGSVSKSQLLQIKTEQKDEPVTTSDNETHQRKTDDDNDDAADKDMPQLSPSQEPEPDEASSAAQPLITRRSLRARAPAKQSAYKEVDEEEEDNSDSDDSETQWEPKEDSNSSGSDWVDSDSESRSKKKREVVPFQMPKENPNITRHYPASRAIPPPHTNTPATTNGLTTTASATAPKLNGVSSCVRVAPTHPDMIPPDLPDEDITVGMDILARRKPLFWDKGKISQIITEGDAQTYEVDFGDEKIVVSGHQMAFCHMVSVERLYVGARVVAMYQEAERFWFDAGVLVDKPNRKNKMRFLVFFDDHTPSYVSLTNLHLVCRQLKDVCEDLTDESHRNFISDYLRAYPSPSLAVYRAGQTVNMEFQGVMRKCVVELVDCQLIQVAFQDEEMKEWVYLGSKRLEYIINLKKRHEKGTDLHKEHPSIPLQMTSTQTIHPSRPGQPRPVPTVPVAAANFHTSTHTTPPTRVQRNELAVTIPTSKRVKYSPHRCCPACLERVRPKDGVKLHIGRNPLLAPLFYEFHRMKARKRKAEEESPHLFYKAPCGLTLSTMALVQDYLHKTRCDFLTLDMFCLDPDVYVSVTAKPLPSKVFVLDISKGKEHRQISCVNELNSDRAILPMYRKDPVATDGVSINTSPDFLVGCDCVDGCKDSVACSCMQLTVQSTALSHAGPMDSSAGYHFKRLYNHIVTGVYECNALCRCHPSSCTNRVVQNGILVRLQVFRTDNRGWGVRVLDDVAMGTFICTFAGRVQSSGKTTGYNTEYCVKLNHIEAAEVHKEDYETEAYCSDSESDDEKTAAPSKGPCVKGKPTAGSTAKEKRPDKSTTSETTVMTRQLFNGEEQCYVIDAGVEGNVARYFNHSCSPNMFVQNVFVDTHDLRFPWMAFFTNKLIKSGSELTWNYRSTAGGVENIPNLQCRCGSEDCRETL